MSSRLPFVPVVAVLLTLTACSEPGRAEADSLEVPELGAWTATPGDRLVEVTTRDYCDESVSAWLDYPLQSKFAYTWFHEAEWKIGNRRSICWAWTTE